MEPVETLLRDFLSLDDVTTLGDPAIVNALTQALAKYSADCPRVVVEDVYTHDIAIGIPQQWTEGFSEVVCVEYPIPAAILPPTPFIPTPFVPSDSDNLVFKVCAVAISGQRAVILRSDDQIEYADYRDENVANSFLGVTLQPSVQGSSAMVKTEGILTEPTWWWEYGKPIFLGANGVLTQIEPPAPGYSWILATPLSATSILLEKQTPVYRI